MVAYSGTMSLRKRLILALSLVTAMVGGVVGLRAGDAITEHFAFTPILASANKNEWNPKAPWVIPDGFTQSVVSDESSLNIYGNGINDWNDMNTVNENGAMAGRY